MRAIATINEFADSARDIINRFDLLNAVKVTTDIHGKTINVFNLLEVRGCSESGDEVINNSPPSWAIINRHRGESMVTPDTSWALCCFVHAYVSLINEIEAEDAKEWEKYGEFADLNETKLVERAAMFLITA